MLHFEWDPIKNQVNIKKHGVSFNEAEEIFYDDMGILIPDPEHSTDEERFILIGAADSTGILIVSHCYVDAREAIRFISARKADKKEKAQYRSQYEN